MLHRREHGAIVQKEPALLVKFFIHYPGLHACACCRVQLFATPWTVAHQAPLFMGFPRQEYWSGLPFPTLGDLPNPGIKLTSLASLALAGGFFYVKYVFSFLSDIQSLPKEFLLLSHVCSGFPGGSEGKASACNVGDLGSIPGSGRSPGEGNGNPLQYSCLENPMDGGAWWATVHGVAKSRTRLSDFTHSLVC